LKNQSDFSNTLILCSKKIRILKSKLETTTTTYKYANKCLV